MEVEIYVVQLYEVFLRSFEFLMQNHLHFDVFALAMQYLLQLWMQQHPQLLLIIVQGALILDDLSL